MADPSESPKRPKSPAEEVDTSGGKTKAEETGCSSNPMDEETHNAESPDTEQRPSVGRDGSARHPEGSVESGAGAGKKICNPAEQAEKMAEARVNDQPFYDWSETEDGDAEEKTHMDADDKCDPKNVPESDGGVQQDTHVDDNIKKDATEEKTPHPDEKSQEKQLTEEPVEKLSRQRGRLECKECGKRFTRRETFNLHRHFHAHEDELTPFTCKECGLTFQHRSSLIKHKIEHKEKEEQLASPKKEGTFKCAECEKVFSTVDKLRDHNCCNTAEKPFRCPLCRQEFQLKMAVTKHMVLHSCDSIYTCQECSLTFPDSMALRYHKRSHTGLKPYECPECGLVFKHYSVMEDHRRKHTDNARSHLCKICGKTFKYSSLLHQHQYLHTGQKPFRCPECGKTFAFAQNMKAHCRQHRLRQTNSSTEQPSKPASAQEAGRGPGKENKHQSEEQKGTFNCPLCPLTYLIPADLRAHMLIHEAEYETLERTPRPPNGKSNHWDIGYTCPHCPSIFRNKPYTCPDCGKKFAFQQNMKTHQKLHQEKPFRCTSCRKGYSDETQLQHHMLSHNGDKPHKCNQCDKSFGLAYLLRDHINTHTGERPHRCDECHKTFSWLSSLLVHQKIHSRKRQGLNQYNSFPMGARIRGRGRRGGRPIMGWSQPVGSSGPQLSPYSVSALSDAELHRRVVQPQQSMLSSHMDVQSRAQKEPWLPELQPVQWKVDGGEVMPVPQQQHAAPQQNQFDSQSNQGQQQHHQRGPGWPDSPLITQSGPTSALSSESSHMKDSAPAIVSSHMVAVPKKSSPSTVSEIEQQRLPKPVIWSSPPTTTVLASTSSLQHGFSTPLSFIDGRALWSIRPALLANSQSSPNKLGQELQLPRWAEKPWNGCELPKQWVSGLPGVSTSAQIDQSSAMPISTPVSHGAVMSERPHMPQTLPLPQLAQRTETHKLGSRLPFAQERLLQCMICGCSLPRELDLQMHYMQHAQGEI
ncbi:Zinc finger protein 184 [Dissostichus eleginoides]|uniref:Zinc finger protein 184 n=1 Tax=Dissostichus eleginoides TaxID=100907 RepID=A0AAD9FAI9_DISEL|nr:Zinc finger protein 184 [Dissostichus eleginoides]